MSKNQDWQWIFPLFQSCLAACQIISHDSALKGLRYIQLMKILIQSQTTRSIVIANECFYHFSTFIPTDINTPPKWPSSTHIEEHVSTLSSLILQAIYCPIPTHIKHIPQTDNLISITELFKFLDNPLVNLFFKNLNQVIQQFSSIKNLTPEQEENQKNQQELSAKLLDYILITKFDKVTWSYVRQALITVFENNKIEIDSSEILRRFVESDYCQKVQTDLLSIVNQMNTNENWMVRKKANFFFRDWYFKQLLENNQQNAEIPDQLIRNFDDKNPLLQTQAIYSLADYLKLYTEQELDDLYENSKTNIEVLMAMLFSRMDRNFKWTDEALRFLLSQYQKNQSKKKQIIQLEMYLFRRIIDFAGEYWKSRQDKYQVFDYKISDQNVQSLNEIVNPYSYFA